MEFKHSWGTALPTPSAGTQRVLPPLLACGTAEVLTNMWAFQLAP